MRIGDRVLVVVEYGLGQSYEKEVILDAGKISVRF